MIDIIDYVALLRAVNVGGTGKLAMTDLTAMCEAAGFLAVRTYIASGNVVFRSSLNERAVKAALESRLHDYAGKNVGVAVRRGAEMADVLAQNPFADAPGNRVVAIFFDEPVSPAMLKGVTGRGADEDIRLGRRELYVLHGSGIGNSKLRIASARNGTARNMNTIAKLTQMTGS
jgi:uncharacterized protein (DUF1697 family)